MLKESEWNAVEAYFRNRDDIQTVFLFGSVAKGRVRSASDVDLAVWLAPSVPESAYLNMRLQFMADLSQRLKAEADLVILNEAGPVLIHQVLRDGRVIYEKDSRLTTALKARAMLDYVDWLPYQERLDRSVLEHFKRLHSHGR